MTVRHRVAVGDGEVAVAVSSATHVGRVRSVNEDSVLVGRTVFAVADGMGGHAFGDRASAAAVQSLASVDADPAPGRPARVLDAIHASNVAVREVAAAAGGRRIAGTTLTGVALVREQDAALPRWMVFNLGDSRVYRWDPAAPAPRRLERISVDHSVVQELLDAGYLDEDGARFHPERHVVTRALGASPTVEPEAWLLPGGRAQTFLICSDGLTKEVSDGRIAELLAQGSGVEGLLAEALDAGGHDNISIVLVEAQYREAAAAAEDRDRVDEQTRDRALSPELEDTLPRL